MTNRLQAARRPAVGFPQGYPALRIDRLSPARNESAVRVPPPGNSSYWDGSRCPAGPASRCARLRLTSVRFSRSVPIWANRTLTSEGRLSLVQMCTSPSGRTRTWTGSAPDTEIQPPLPLGNSPSGGPRRPWLFMEDIVPAACDIQPPFPTEKGCSTAKVEKGR